MSDFKEGDLLEHRASGERCIFFQYCDDEKTWSYVSRGLEQSAIQCISSSLTKVKEESNG